MTCLNEQQSSQVLTTMASIGSHSTEQLNVNMKSIVEGNTYIKAGQDEVAA